MMCLTFLLFNFMRLEFYNRKMKSENLRNPYISRIITSLASNKVLRNIEIFDFVLFREVLICLLLQQQLHMQLLRLPLGCYPYKILPSHCKYYLLKVKLTFANLTCTPENISISSPGGITLSSIYVLFVEFLSTI